MYRSDILREDHITQLYLSSAPVYGNIGSVADQTAMTRLYMSSTLVEGVLDTLAGMTSMGILAAALINITGDLNTLANFTSATNLNVYSTKADSMDYTTVALPAWAGTSIRIESNGLSSSEVDQFLIDLADGVGASGTIKIAGTNAARTAASDAAKATLLSNSWTVEVNE